MSRFNSQSLHFPSCSEYSETVFNKDRHANQVLRKKCAGSSLFCSKQVFQKVSNTSANSKTSVAR